MQKCILITFLKEITVTKYYLCGQFLKLNK